MKSRPAHRGPTLALWIALGLCGTLLLPGGIPSADPPRAMVPADHAAGRTVAGGPPPLPNAPINTSLVVNASSVNLSSDFWGVTVNNEVHLLRGETDAVNATPARVLVWPGAMAGEDYDPLSDTHYDTYSGAPVHALTSEEQFVQMCEATRCIAVMQVPAEIDDPAYAEAIVNYTEVNLSFHPAYWMIGNEPELWSHWKVPWKDWGSDYTTGPTPTQFGQEVVAYVKAIRQVDTSTPILGLPASGCTCGSWTFAQWIYDVLEVTGTKIQAVAFHEYPAGWLGTGDGSLLDFYGTLRSPANIPIRMVAARAAVAAACGTCNVSVFISELGSALSYSAYGQYAAGFSGALSIASQITQAMDDNLTNVDLFAAQLDTTNSWFNTTGYARPDYALYTQVLDHLGPRAYSVNFSATPGSFGQTLYGIDTLAPGDHGRQDLLVANDNITRAANLTPLFAGAPSSAPVEAWVWNGSIHRTLANTTTWVEPFTPDPVPMRFPSGLPSTFVLPPQSLVLFETYPGGASYVRVNDSGVPPGTPWYVSFGSTFYTTTGSNLSLLLPAGSYPVASSGIPLPLGGRELEPSERLAPFVSSPLRVAGVSTNLTVGFVPQWRVNATGDPGGAGQVLPTVGWWNVSEPLRLTARSNPGFAFVGWTGWGRGSYNGSDPTVTVVPGGRLLEKARFEPGRPVQLVETGLLAGTLWSVTIRQYTSNSTGRVLTVYEPVGKYGYSVDPIPGYRIVPRNGSFAENGSAVQLAIRFELIRPPGRLYPVQFEVSGLPGTIPLTITVRGATRSVGIAPPLFELWNGSYAYQVSFVPGYHENVSARTFAVEGAGLTIAVPFIPTVYRAIWAASGTRSGTSWGVELAGRTFPASSAWAATALPNGTYPYRIVGAEDFSIAPRTGTVLVNGLPWSVQLYFTLLRYPAWFEANGPGSSGGWSVRLGNLTANATTDRSSFLEPNGSYTFDVDPPDGFYAVPSHGTLTVAGAMAPTLIVFRPSSLHPSAALVAALTSGALSVSIWIGGSVIGGFALVRWLRRRGD